MVTVALHDGEEVLTERRSEQRMKHGEQLAPLIDAVLTGAGVVRQDLTAFAVATDARRKEVYLATYDDRGRRVGGPEVVRPADAATDRPVAGEGAVLYPGFFPDARDPALPGAGWLARAVAEELAELHDPEP